VHSEHTQLVPALLAADMLVTASRIILLSDYLMIWTIITKSLVSFTDPFYFPTRRAKGKAIVATKLWYGDIARGGPHRHHRTNRMRNPFPPSSLPWINSEVKS